MFMDVALEVQLRFETQPFVERLSSLGGIECLFGVCFIVVLEENLLIHKK